MITIWKYKLETTDIQYIEMPVSSKLLTVQIQNEEPYLWCLIQDNDYLIPRKIRIIGTGHLIEDAFNGTYISTYQIFNGDVFHVFEINKG